MFIDARFASGLVHVGHVDARPESRIRMHELEVAYKQFVSGTLVPFTYSSTYVADNFLKQYKKRPLVPSPAELQGFSAADKAKIMKEYRSKV